MSIPAMFASDMATAVIGELDECPIAGITHANPLPTHSTWAKSALRINAVSRRVRPIIYQDNGEVHAKVPSRRQSPFKDVPAGSRRRVPTSGRSRLWYSGHSSASLYDDRETKRIGACGLGAAG